MHARATSPLLLIILLCSSSAAQDAPAANDLTAEFGIEVVANNLNNPCALALRHGSRSSGVDAVYFAESGAGRIAVVTTDKPGEVGSAVKGFPTGPCDLGQAYVMGPLGTDFITAGKLAVGFGGGDRGPARVCVYLLETGAVETIDWEAFDHEVRPSSRRSGGEGVIEQFFGLAHNDASLFVVGGGPGGDWILEASITKNRLSDLQCEVDGLAQTSVQRPVAATIDDASGNGYLVAGHIGAITADRDSVLVFYAPKSGRVAATFRAGLYDLVDVAYSSSGNLYAIDAAWHDGSAGGVYRLDAQVVDNEHVCQAVKIAAAVHPTSLAFASDGSMYVTAFGPAGDARNGQLIKITGPF